MATTNFELIAKVLVDQHYASGPEEMKRVVAEALVSAASGATEQGADPRVRLEKEVEEQVLASARGSE